MCVSATDSETMTVLIVEDQQIMRRMLREFLQSAYPASFIVEADSGERALELCESHRPRLVLMDVKLPDANGIALTARIRTILPDTIVLVVSQYSAQTYVDRAMAAGAFAYVLMDRVYRELLPTIERALGTLPAAPDLGETQ